MTKPVLFSFMSGLSDLWPPPPHELYILTIPVLFHIILCCFRSNFGSSVLCPVYMYCVLYLAFLHVAIFFLFAVLPGFCLSVLAMYFVLSSTLQTPPFLLNWYQKTKFTSLRQYHFICICEGGGGRGQGGPWPMGDSGSCSGVLKYAVTWYCISTFTSLHRGLEGWGGGREWGNSYRMVRWGQRWILRRELIFWFYCLETTSVERVAPLKTTPTPDSKHRRTTQERKRSVWWHPPSPPPPPLRIRILIHSLTCCSIPILSHILSSRFHSFLLPYIM